jgi:hypothetical protein
MNQIEKAAIIIHTVGKYRERPFRRTKLVRHGVHSKEQQRKKAITAYTTLNIIHGVYRQTLSRDKAEESMKFMVHLHYILRSRVRI